MKRETTMKAILAVLIIVGLPMAFAYSMMSDAGITVSKAMNEKIVYQAVPLMQPIDGATMIPAGASIPESASQLYDRTCSKALSYKEDSLAHKNNSRADLRINYDDRNEAGQLVCSVDLIESEYKAVKTLKKGHMSTYETKMKFVKTYTRIDLSDYIPSNQIQSDVYA